MSGIAVGWGLLVLAVLLTAQGVAAGDRAWFLAALLVALAAAGLAVLAPSQAQRDAARRNHARPKGWQR